MNTMVKSSLFFIFLYLVGFTPAAWPFIGMNTGSFLQGDAAGDWVDQVGTTTALNTPATAGVAIDSAANTYTVGSIDASFDGNTLYGAKDAFIVKYNSSGTKQWSRQIGASGATVNVRGVATDTANNAYIVGYTNGGLDGNTQTGTNDFFIIKYDSDGVKQWTRQVGVSAKDIQAMGIATDSSNNVYITGRTPASIDGNPFGGFVDFFVAKYNSSGTKQWIKQLGTAGGTTVGYGIDTDSLGNVYISGYAEVGLDGNTLTGTRDLFISKYDTDGVKQWTKQMGVAAKETHSYSLSVDSADNPYIGGYTKGALDGNTLTGTTDLFVIKYNSSGTKQWSKLLGVASKIAEGDAITTDSSNNVYIAGYTNGSLDGNTLAGFQDIYVTKYDSSGTKQWTKQIGVSLRNTRAQGITVDSSANVYVAGVSSGNLDSITLVGAVGIALLKYNTSGTKQWSVLLGGGASKIGSSYVNGIALDASENIFVSGTTTGGLNGNDQVGSDAMYISKYNSNKVKQWTVQTGGQDRSTTGGGVAVDSSGNAYIVGGTTSNTLDGVSRTGANDNVIIKYNSSGTKQWTKLLGVTAKDTIGIAIAVDSSSNVYAAGTTTGNLDGNTLSGTLDFFITKYNTSGTKQWTKQLGSGAASTTNTYGIAVDSGDNAYVIGDTNAGMDGNSLTGTKDLFVVKYDSSGTKQWTKQLGVASKATTAYGVTTDSSNNVYLAGSTTGGLDGNSLTGTMDFFVTKYNSSGTKQWTKQLGVASKDTAATSVTLDRAGNIYVSGWTKGSLDGNTITGTIDAFVTKYDSSGTKQWTKHLGAASKSLYGNGVVIDPHYNLYIGGYANGGIGGNTQTGTNDIVLIKYGGGGL